jgi:ABC-type transport system substrate-binding protein
VVFLVGASLLATGTTRLSAHSVVKRLPILRLDKSGDPHLDGIIDTFLNHGPASLWDADLVKIRPNGSPAPGLASWRISKNGRVYTFTIRKNARFANGHYVTASDAAFTLRRDLTPSIRGGLTDVAQFFGLIQGAEAYQSGKTKTLSGVKVLGRRLLRITITQDEPERHRDRGARGLRRRGRPADLRHRPQNDAGLLPGEQ